MGTVMKKVIIISRHKGRKLFCILVSALKKSLNTKINYIPIACYASDLLSKYRSQLTKQF